MRESRYTSRLAGVLALAMLASSGVYAQVSSAESPTLQWYRGNTHTHTSNSDGDSSPDVVARWYREHGYQFLFITDHDHVTDVGALNELPDATGRFLVLPGQEITQWSDDPKRSASRVSARVGAPAHVNALFTTQIIRPVGTAACASPCGANSPADMLLSEVFKVNFAAITVRGGIAQINHPNLLWSLRPEDLIETPDGTLIEIWNGQGRRVNNNLGGDDGAGDVRPSGEGFWDWLLSRGKIVWAVGADDSHAFREPDVHDPGKSAPGRAWIVVRAKALTPAALRAAISSGDFYASTGVVLDDIAHDSAQLTIAIKAASPDDVRFMPRYVTRFIGHNGETLASVPGTRPGYRFKGSETYVRATITDSNGNQAWTQPVFLDARKHKVPQVRGSRGQ